MKIEVPKSAAQIYLDGFQELNRIKEPDVVDSISCLLGYDRSLVRRFTARSVEEVSSAIQECFNRKFTLVKTFDMGRTTFGFIPNLDDATYGECDDIRAFLSDIQSWHKAMAVMYRPVKFARGEKYLIEDYVPGKYDEVMKGAPMDVVMGAQVFFWNLTSDLLKHIPNYTKEEVMKERHGSGKSGADIITLYHLLGETGKQWKQLLEKTYTVV